MPSIAFVTNAGTISRSSRTGSVSNLGDGSSTPVIPTSLQRTAHRPSAVSNATVAVVSVMVFILWRTRGGREPLRGVRSALKRERGHDDRDTTRRHLWGTDAGRPAAALRVPDGVRDVPPLRWPRLARTPAADDGRGAVGSAAHDCTPPL